MKISGRLVYSLPDIIILKDKEGRWQEANCRAQQLFSLYNLECTGRTDSELKSLYPEVYRNFIRCFGTGEAVWNKATPTVYEESVVLKDGMLHTFEIIKAPLFDRDRQRKGTAVVARDITDRKLEGQCLEQALNELAHFKYALDQSAIVAITDLSGTLPKGL